MGSNDVSNIAQVLVPIADKWLELGCALGFRVDELERFKAANLSTPTVNLMLEVLRSGHASCHGDTPKFVNALVSALRSPTVGAQHLAIILAQGNIRVY